MFNHQEIEDHKRSVSYCESRAKPMSWAMKAVCFVIGLIGGPIAILVIMVCLDAIATYIY